MEKQLKKMIKARSAYEKELGEMESMLSGKIDFEFGIENLPGDGFCILHVDSANLAGLDKCIKIIKEKGKLSYDDFDEFTI